VRRSSTQCRFFFHLQCIEHDVDWLVHTHCHPQHASNKKRSRVRLGNRGPATSRCAIITQREINCCGTALFQFPEILPVSRSHWSGEVIRTRYRLNSDRLTLPGAALGADRHRTVSTLTIGRPCHDRPARAPTPGSQLPAPHLELPLPNGLASISAGRWLIEGEILCEIAKQTGGA